MRSTLVSLVTVAMVTLLVAVPHAAPATPQDEATPQEQPEKTLYERLGGIYPIALVVDDFIDRLMVNETLNANPEIAERRVPQRLPGLKYRVSELVCQATGGPCTYTGKSMAEAHAGMNITEEQWQAMMADFKASLDHFGVGAVEQEELFAIVESTKGDIVVSDPSQ